MKIQAGYINFRIIAVFAICLTVVACSIFNPVRTTSTKGFNPGKINKIVVLVESENIKQMKNTGLQYQLESEVISALLESGYQVMGRSDLKALQAEIRLQQKQTGIKNPAVKGMFASVPTKLIVKVTKVITDIKTVKDKNGKNYQNYISYISISARLLNLQSSQVLWTARTDQKRKISKNMEANAIQDVMMELVESFPARS